MRLVYSCCKGRIYCHVAGDRLCGGGGGNVFICGDDVGHQPAIFAPRFFRLYTSRFDGWWGFICGNSDTGNRYVAPTLPDAAEVTTRTPSPATLTNTEALGHLIYTYYIYLFQGAGLILLVAMVGAIVLTLRTRKGVKRQKIADQNAITADQSVAVVKVEKGRGVSS